MVRLLDRVLDHMLFAVPALGIPAVAVKGDEAAFHFQREGPFSRDHHDVIGFALRLGRMLCDPDRVHHRPVVGIRHLPEAAEQFFFRVACRKFAHMGGNHFRHKSTCNSYQYFTVRFPETLSYYN